MSPRSQCYAPRARTRRRPNAAGDEKLARIPRVDEPPLIDGRLDDAVWSQATVIDDLHQVTPVEYAQPTERTVVYVLYDHDTLYVGARMFDREPELINARVLRQNQPIGPDDRFFVHLDPFGNRRSGYLFGLNPNAVRFDGVFQNVTDRQFDWDGIWRAAASINDEGWIAEIAIPFKTLSFDPANGSWRMNFVRNLIRRNESMAWARATAIRIRRRWATSTGSQDLDQGMGLDVVPSMSMSDSKVFATSSNDGESEPSLDVFYKVTPALNAALTINTDFSSTEVDNRQVNLTRFNLFFPERRDFFLQDLDIFQFASIGRMNTGNDALENSASNAGVARERPTVLLAAAGDQPDRRGGRARVRRQAFRPHRPLGLGALAVRQDEFATAAATIAPTTALVGRIAANVLEESASV